MEGSASIGGQRDYARRPSGACPAPACAIRIPHPISWWYVVSTPYEIYRAALPTRTPDGEPATLIVTRQGQGCDQFATGILLTAGGAGTLGLEKFDT